MCFYLGVFLTVNIYLILFGAWKLYILLLFVFVFYSVGLENVEDLKKDLEQALEKV